MTIKYVFPFGEPLTKVEQKEKGPKQAFLLGVYASAVHAYWVDENGKQKVKALAVASEPNIFWTGKNAEEIISRIKIPKEMGKLLVPKDRRLNGPSGKVLDDKFLTPLELNRKNTWLCDLLPESRVNVSQRKALDKYYTKELIKKYNLPEATIPDFNKSELNSLTRREEILKELEESKADTLILLGDLPIRYFLNTYAPSYKKLSQFGETKETYGKPNQIEINNKIYNVIALCHPRQAGRLGSSNAKWGMLHDHWIKTIKN